MSGNQIVLVVGNEQFFFRENETIYLFIVQRRQHFGANHNANFLGENKSARVRIARI